MKIRIVRRGDFKKGLKECLEALTTVGDPQPYLVDFYCRRRADRRVLTYVAVEGRDIVGTASVIIEPKLIHNCGMAGHVEDVAVHPKHQGKGIGKLLMEHIIKKCRMHRCYKVVLNCDPKNVAFYEKYGFKKTPDVFMRLDIA